MSSQESTVSLADLSAAGVIVRYAEAVTIVRELALRVSRGELRGVPSPHVIRLSPSGGLSVEGPVAAGSRGVARAAYLLETLLPGFEAPPELRVPAPLRLVVARALGTLDLPRYESLDLFAEALSRFAAPDAVLAVRDLVARRVSLIDSALQRSEQPLLPDDPVVDAADRELFGGDGRGRPVRIEPWPPAELTISDIRRARRATGLTLAEISERTQISPRLLCELEWGYFRNWPASLFGRRRLARYARAAGLDDQLVIRTIWPLLEESVRANGTLSDDLDGARPADMDGHRRTALIGVPQNWGGAAGRHRWWRKKGLLAALAIPAVLAIGVVPELWRRSIPATSSPVDGPSERRMATLPAAAHKVPIHDVAQVTTDARLDTAGNPVAGIPKDADQFPSFHTAGSAMFYHAGPDDSAPVHGAGDSRGSILRITSVVDNRARNFHARPSPDGARIAFDSDRDGGRAVYIADANGHNLRRVSGEGFAAIPSWSPDGGTIAFVRAEPDRPKVWNLWTVDLSTGQTRRLTAHRAGQPWGGSWFPDGRRLAFSLEQRLIVMDLSSRTEKVYASPIRGRLVRTPAVSPDGSRIMFQVDRDGAWLLELRDGSVRKVLSDPSAEEYTWAPDGSRVAYHSRGADKWGIWVMAPRSSQ